MLIFIVIDYLLSAKQTIFQLLVASLFKCYVLVSCVADTDIFLDYFVVTKLGCFFLQRKRHFDVPEKWMVFVVDKILYHFICCQLLPVFLQHVQLLQLLNQLPMFLLVLVYFSPIYFVLIEPLLTDLQVHTVESDHHRFISDLGFDGVQSRNQIQQVLLEGEEKDIRVQSKFEPPGDNNVTIIPGHPLVFVVRQLDPHQPVRIRSARADILPHIEDKIVLKR